MSLEQAGVTSFSDLVKYGEQWVKTPADQPVATTSFFSRIWQPIANIGQSLYEPMMRTYESTVEALPDVLARYAGQKLGLYEQPEGAGVTTVYPQPAYAGGTPASMPYVVVTPTGTAPIGGAFTTKPIQQAGISSSLILIAVIAIVAIMFFNK